MIDDKLNEGPKVIQLLKSDRSGFWGLSSNLWKVAFVSGISQFSISLWNWEFSIFLNEIMQPWQMGLVFSTCTFAGVLGYMISGTIADYMGRKWTMATALIPTFLGLITLAYTSIWPLILVQFGLVWYGVFSVRIMSRAIPADEIASDEGRNPARRIMMVMMPMLFVDGIGPLIGAFMLSSGLTSHDLFRTSAFCALVSFLAASFLVEESLGAQVIEKAKAGSVISFRQLGSDFWRLLIGMVIFYFCWNAAFRYQGILCVDAWDVDIVTYGLTWSTFSLAGATIMYFLSNLADRNLKMALSSAVAGNGLVFIAFGLGNGVPLMFLLNFLWAFPCITWVGAERSLIVLSVSEETKGRALGTYQLVMSIISIAAASFGALLWTMTGSIRILWVVAGAGMLCSLLLLVPILKTHEIAS